MFRFMEDRQGERKRGEQPTNRARERDDEIISTGMCFAPEGQIVLRLSELCRVSGRSRSQQFANTLGRWRSISLILQTTNDNANGKLADAATNNKRR